MTGAVLVPIKTPGHAGSVDLLAGVLCLDFVNTVEPRVVPLDGGPLRDYLTSYADLVQWSLHAAALRDSTAHGLVGEAAQHPRRARAALEQAVALREMLYHIFLAIAHHRLVDAGDLAALSTAYAQAMSQVCLTSVGAGFGLAWTEDAMSLARPLWPIARSAVDLLLEGEQQRVKECPDGCGWLFYDTSKNVSRRWCSMRGCGAHAKERRRGKRHRTTSRITSEETSEQNLATR